MKQIERKYYYPLNEDGDEVEIFHDLKKDEILMRLKLDSKITDFWLSAELTSCMARDLNKLADKVWYNRESKTLEESLYGYEGIDF